MLKFPFSKVDGIELSEQIANIAIKNFKILNFTKSKIFIGNATVFNHYDNYNIFYLYNPFPCKIVSEVIRRLKWSLEKSDREILIIYNNPVCDGLIKKEGFFKIEEYPNEGKKKIYIYSNKNLAFSRLTVER
ncbi:MAG: hypothetical protein Q8O01_07225, partial [Candidatus Omnitrophota bacterium]|nr:hypothetical protein [Candidatus Omnitrophota bacterium]